MDTYHKRLHRLLHQTMDRLVDACAVCNAHGDILSAPDDDDDLDDKAMADEGYEPPSQASHGSAIKLLKAQLQSKGGENDIPYYQGLINCTTNLLINHKARLKIQEEPPQP